MLNKLIIKTLPLIPKSIVHVFAKKYIAGDELSDAVNITKQLNETRTMTTIDVLGEFVTERDRAIHEKGNSLLVLKAIKENKLQTYLSVKPTSLGLGIDTDFGYQNISEIVRKAAELGIFVRLDMENSPFTSNTLDCYRKLRSDGLKNVGVVIQAYMRRSEVDIRSLIEYNAPIRLCKGIYREDEKIAFRDPDEIRKNYKKLLDLILDNKMYVGIATHDEELIQYARQSIKERKLSPEQYELQMLLGVREERRRELVAEGHRMRVYVPFGKDWYGYSTRRMKENPDIAMHVVKAILGKK
ncbi:MAG: proline dehydrogenase family protein [Candidatus Kapabacteria bacterium]|nr:proline dehydrogenase family protein [Candidatus Kapabacteria bacterium]